MAELQHARKGGRPPGSKDLHTLMGRENIKRYTVEATEFAVSVMRDRVPCNVCDGTGKQPIEGQPGKFHDRKCSSCKGRRRDRLRPELRFAAACEIMDRGGVPREKAMEISGTIDLEINGLVEKLAAGRARAAGLLAVPVRAVIEAAEADEE